jgi:hypothetical protein
MKILIRSILLNLKALTKRAFNKNKPKSYGFIVIDGKWHFGGVTRSEMDSLQIDQFNIFFAGVKRREQTWTLKK